MDFKDLVKIRQSVREYSGRKVERDAIERCLEAARLAPSACNSQPWKFVVIDTPELREKVAKATFGALVRFNHFTLTAPVMVVLVSEPGNLRTFIGKQMKGIEFRLIDMGIAAEHFCLQAAEEGLGTCMLGWFDEKALKKSLGLPDGTKVDMVITLGYPADNYPVREKARKSMDKIREYR